MWALQRVCLNGSECEVCVEGRSCSVSTITAAKRARVQWRKKKNHSETKDTPCDLMTMYQPPTAYTLGSRVNKKKNDQMKSVPWNNPSATAANKHSYCQKLRVPKCRVYSFKVKTCRWIWFFFLSKILQQQMNTKIARHCPQSVQPLDWTDPSYPWCPLVGVTLVHAFVFLMKCYVSVFFFSSVCISIIFTSHLEVACFCFHTLSSAPFPNLLDEAECWFWRQRQEGRWRASDLRFEE